MNIVYDQALAVLEPVRGEGSQRAGRGVAPEIVYSSAFSEKADGKAEDRES